MQIGGIMKKNIFNLILRIFVFVFLFIPGLSYAEDEEWDRGEMEFIFESSDNRPIPNGIAVYSVNGKKPNAKIESGSHGGVSYTMVLVSPDENTVIETFGTTSGRKGAAVWDGNLSVGNRQLVALINGSLFEDSKINGVTISNGEQISDHWPDRYGVFWFNSDNSKASISNAGSDTFGGYSNAIAGVYPIISNGTPGNPSIISYAGGNNYTAGSYYEKDLGGGSKRMTIIGQKANGTYVLMALKNSSNITFADMLSIAQKEGLVNALRMDGGGSSQIWATRKLNEIEENEGEASLPSDFSSSIAQGGGGPSGGFNIRDDSDANIMNLEGTEEETAYNFALRATAQEREVASEGYVPLYERITQFFTGSTARQADWQVGSSNEIMAQGENSLSEGSIENFHFACVPNGTCERQRTDYEKKEISGAEVSVKAAAMKLQNLQKKYDYNIMMVLQAYNFGETAMDKLLELYEEQTGVTTEDAIKDNKNTSWANYAAEICVHPTRYGFGSGEGAFDEESEEVTCAWGDYKYVEHVLSRDTYGGFSYIYLPEEDSTRGYQEGNWLSSFGLTDKETANVRNILSTSSDSGLVRAYSTWRGMEEEERENVWTMMTMGQKEYTSGMPGLFPSIAEIQGDNPSTAMYMNSHNFSSGDKEGLLKDLFLYGTNITRDEISVERDEIWQARFGNVFGGGEVSNSVTASIKYTEYFDKYDNLMEPVVNYEEISTPFGYDKSGFRTEFSSMTIYGGVGEMEDGISISAIPRDAARPILEEGTVIYVSQRIDGYTVTVDYGEKNGYSRQSIFYYLDSVNVSEGDVLGKDSFIGHANAETKEVGHELLINDQSVDYEEILADYKKEMMKEYRRIDRLIRGIEYLYDESGNYIGSAEAWARAISEGRISQQMMEQYFKGSASYGNFGFSGAIWNADLAHIVSSLKNAPYDSAGVTDADGCAAVANAFLQVQYNIQFQVNGGVFAEQLCAKYPERFVLSDTPAPGGIFSAKKGGPIIVHSAGHVGVIKEVNGDTITYFEGGCGWWPKEYNLGVQDNICLNSMPMSEFRKIYVNQLTFCVPR